VGSAEETVDERRAMSAAEVTSSGLSTADLAARVQRLEDIEAIRALFIEYGKLADMKDWVGYSDLFVEDGTFDSPHSVGTVTGSKEIRERLGSAYGDDPEDAYHVFDNIEIAVEGDRATARSLWTYLRPGDNGGPPQVLMFGKYEDELVRTDAGWKFQLRRCGI
jgi:ketosteroid isomerase-like protein